MPCLRVRREKHIRFLFNFSLESNFMTLWEREKVSKQLALLRIKEKRKTKYWKRNFALKEIILKIEYLI